MSKTTKHSPTIRSSAAEYLTFVAASGEGGVEAIYVDEDVWLSQKMMAVLYDVNVRTINEHLKKIFTDNELAEDAVIRKFRITATDGKTYNTQHYNLSAIIAVGYKVNSERAVQFRKWATHIVKEYTIKAYVMDDERLKNDGSILGKKYFEEQLQRIREIRLSERKFYQKITDIYATAIDYDVTATATQRFFATVQFVFAGNDSEGLKYGTIGTEDKYFLSWKEDEAEDSGYKLDKYLAKLCEKTRLIELMHDFVLFDGGIKKLPRVHQYFGIKAAQEYVRRRQGGILWHTQGSGKR